MSPPSPMTVASEGLPTPRHVHDPEGRLRPQNQLDSNVEPALTVDGPERENVTERESRSHGSKPSLPSMLRWLRINYCYILTMATVSASFLLWYNFSAPPYGSNNVINLFLIRQVNLSSSLFTSYYWPGTYIPQAFGAPYAFAFGGLFAASAGSLSVPQFTLLLVVNVSGGLCLFSLVSRWLSRYSIPKDFGLVSVLVFSFNSYYTTNGYGTYAGAFAEGPFTPGDPAILVVLGFLAYLALFRDLRYVLLLGLVSFFAFAIFPISTYVLTVEFLVVILVLLAYKWESLRKQELKGRLRDIGGRTLSILAAATVGNAYLVYPLILTGSSYLSAASTSSPNYPFNYGGNDVATLQNSVRLVSNWFLATPYAPTWASAYLSNPGLIVMTSVLPALALGSFVFLRGRTDRGLYLSMIVAILAATASNPPAGALFKWLTTHVALLRAFYNAYTYSPLLLLFYSVFSALTVGVITVRLEKRGSRRRVDSRSTTEQRPNERRFRRLPRAHFGAIFVIAVVAVLLGSAYPSLSPSFDVGSPGFPMATSLPNYYVDATNFLQKTAPNDPVMVFPAPSDFVSIGSNGSVWYNGPNTYPYLIGNPNIAWAVPPDYLGSTPNQLSVPGFVYTIGNDTCPPTPCDSEGSNLIPQLGVLAGNQSASYTTNNLTIIDWQDSTPGDSLQFAAGSLNPYLVLRANVSIGSITIHRLQGALSRVTNLSSDSYAIVTYTFSGPDPGALYFDLVSGGNLAVTSYLLSSYSQLVTTDGEQVAVLPLTNTSSFVNRSAITGIGLSYEPVANVSGVATLRVDSIRFSSYEGTLPQYGWSVSGQGDHVAVVSNGSSSWVNFSIARATPLPYNAHYLTASFDSSQNLSSVQFARISFSALGLDPQSLLFGYRSAPGGGVEFSFSDCLMVHDGGGRYTALVPLSAPSSSLGDNSLSGVLQVYLVYQPSAPSRGLGFLNISSVSLIGGHTSGAAILAHDMARLGVAFAYVDTAIESSLTQSWIGSYFDSVFSTSPWFVRVFHEGTVTVYQNLAFSGLFAATSNLSVAPTTNATIGDQTFPYVQIYANDTNFNVTYLSGSVPTASYGPATITGTQTISPTEYRLSVVAKGWTLLVFRADFDGRWTATDSSDGALSGPYLVDGFANGWLAPPGSYNVTIELSGQTSYGLIETLSYLTPLGLGAAFLIAVFWARIWKRRRP